MARRYLSDEQKREAAESYRRGERFGDVAKAFGIGTSTLHRILKQFRVSSRLGSDPDKRDVRRSLDVSTELRIVREYTQGTVASKLAFENNVSMRTIYETLERYSVKRRPKGSGKVGPDARQRITEAAKKRWTNKEIRKKYLPLLMKTGFRITGLRCKQPSTKQYRAFRSAILARDGNACVRCWSALSLDIHHKIHRIIRPDLVFNPANVETLCHRCHMREEANRKHHLRRIKEAQCRTRKSRD